MNYKRLKCQLDEYLTTFYDEYIYYILKIYINIFIINNYISYIKEENFFMGNKDKKAEKFKELAEKRVTDTLKKLQLIGNLANKNNYDYTDEQVKQIIYTLESEIKTLKLKFTEENKQQSTEFKFK